jgi:hypothetical protein
MSEGKSEITAKNLLERGYRKFNDTHNLSDMLYQKAIARGDQRLYFVNFYYYAHPEINRFSAEIYFELTEGRTARITLTNFSDIESVEDFAAKFFDAFNCMAYDSR